MTEFPTHGENPDAKIGHPETEKEQVLEKILTRDLPSHQLPEAFFSYSGGIVPRDESVLPKDAPEVDHFKTMSYTDIGEHGLITGGKSRVIATAEVAKAFPEMPIITTSRFYADWPTHAAVIEKELIDRGVNSERIMKEELSFSTISQLVEMIKMAVDRNWQRVVAITNEYHLPRMGEMLNQLDQLFAHDADFMEAYAKFKENNGEVALVSAEEILSNLDGRWKKLIDAARETELYKKTEAAEQKGLADLQAGRYVVSKEPKALPNKSDQLKQ